MVPSRRTFALYDWLRDRATNLYPTLPNYQADLATPPQLIPLHLNLYHQPCGAIAGNSVVFLWGKLKRLVNGNCPLVRYPHCPF